MHVRHAHAIDLVHGFAQYRAMAESDVNKSNGGPIEPKPRRVLGQDDGLFEVPEDFDAPLPGEVLALFES